MARAHTSSTRTLVHVQRQMGKHQALTITYECEKDGRLTETRTIEPTEVVTTKAGNLVIKAFCVLQGENRSFRLDRLISYTCHRSKPYANADAIQRATASVQAATSEAKIISKEITATKGEAEELSLTDVRAIIATTRKPKKRKKAKPTKKRRAAVTT
ncbi:WYL domain-containing protein [Streptomyces hydrogenans]|uniref:WYL domain-containing protein n=1 Tax=Streptomyces hydrogenans TaxID=1873719 RepID=UPI00380FA988